MSFTAQLTYELVYTAQALATLGGSPEWDAAVTKMLATQSLCRADENYGVKAKADEEAGWVKIHLEDRYGKEWKHHPEASSEVAVLQRSGEQADATFHEKYTKPYWAAMRALAHTPAPTLAAACFKQSVIQHDEVWNDSDMKGDCMELVTADFARLTAVTTGANRP